jgi:patatin-like phospholipase/acyl hydrolase
MIGPPRSSFASVTRRERLYWPPNAPFRILSIDGGGIKGIFPAAVLASLEEQYLGGQSIAPYFDLIVGTSTGGIIALGLGAGLTGKRMLSMYLESGRYIFPPGRFARWWTSLRAMSLYRYDRGALTEALDATLGTRALATSSSRLCIPAFEGHHGEVYIFKTPHHPAYRLDGSASMVTVGQATSAAPTYFQALDSGGYRFVDGGVWANNPIMIGLVDALACYSVDPSRVQMLSLGCGRNAAIVTSGQAVGGLVTWRKIIVAAMDLQSQNAMGQARLLTSPESVLRIEPVVSAPIALDDWSRATAELPLEADRVLRMRADAIRRIFLMEQCVKPTFYWPPQTTSVSNIGA